MSDSSQSNEDISPEPKEGFNYIETDTRSIHGYEVESKGYEVGGSEDSESVYAGGWARKQMETTFNGYTLGYSYTEDRLNAVTVDSDTALNHIVLGQVAQGKTVYLRNFLIQVAVHGQGFCYLDRFDSQGELLNLLPEDRLSDVVLLDMEPESKIDYEYLREVIMDGKIILFKPQSYHRGGNLELDEIITTLVQARSSVDDPDPFYLAWDHMNSVDSNILPRDVVYDLVSRSRSANIGTVFTGQTPRSLHSQEDSRKLLIDNSDIHVGFKLSSDKMNSFALSYDLPVYQTRARQDIGDNLDDYCAIINSPEFDSQMVYPFAPYPPKHTDREIFSGPLLRYKI
jgi:hypothetical protein